jgi:hypothetical protein
MPNLASIRAKAQGLLLVFTLVILGLSAHVNVFQGFFYVADRFPFVMSLFTIVILLGVIVSEFVSAGESKVSRPAVELVWLGLLLVAWLGANVFSTHRWQPIQMDVCNNIPVESNPEFLSAAKTWCYEIQALRAFIWMEWVILLISFASLLSFAIWHSARGVRHVWTTNISQFDPHITVVQKAKRGVSMASSFFGRYRTSKVDRDFNFAPQMEQSQAPLGEQRYSWPQNDQVQRWEDRQGGQEQAAYPTHPHYQTEPGQDWEQFGAQQPSEVQATDPYARYQESDNVIYYHPQ